MANTKTINPHKNKLAAATRRNGQNSGVKKSWEQARQLHQTSQNPKSSPSIARSFLGTTTTIDKTPTQIQEQYNTYINNYKKPNSRRPKTPRQTPPRQMPPRIFNIRTATTPVDQLILVKNFMKMNNMNTPQLRNIIDCLEKLTQN
jgi:hypothetical protein